MGLISDKDRRRAADIPAGAVEDARAELEARKVRNTPGGIAELGERARAGEFDAREELARRAGFVSRNEVLGERVSSEGKAREFETGAFRNAADGKLDYDGFLSPLALEAYATYLDFHRDLEDGTRRDSDNWQLGIPVEVYRKSMLRHCIDAWKALRGYPIKENLIWALCGAMFNIQGILHEMLKRDPTLLDARLLDEKEKRSARRAKQ